MLSLPFTAVVVVFAFSCLNALTPPRIDYTQTRAVIHFATLRSVPTLHYAHSFVHLPNPQKTTPALCFQRRQPTPSLRYASFRLSLSATLAPLAIGSRLSLKQAGKHCATLRNLPTCFRSAQGCFTCSVFATPTRSPRPPTLEKSCIAVIKPYRAKRTAIKQCLSKILMVE